MAEYTPEQYTAFAFVALEKGDPGAWRKIGRHRLSFTDPEWGPGQQLYGSLSETFRRLLITPGAASGLGFAARTNPDGTVNEEDARRKGAQWKLLLTPEDDT